MNMRRYIKDSKGNKVNNRVRSINITEEQQEFLNEHKINLSLYVRDCIEKLMREVERDKTA